MWPYLGATMNRFMSNLVCGGFFIMLYRNMVMKMLKCKQIFFDDVTLRYSIFLLFVLCHMIDCCSFQLSWQQAIFFNFFILFTLHNFHFISLMVPIMQDRYMCVNSIMVISLYSFHIPKSTGQPCCTSGKKLTYLLNVLHFCFVLQFFADDMKQFPWQQTSGREHPGIDN